MGQRSSQCPAVTLSTVISRVRQHIKIVRMTFWPLFLLSVRALNSHAGPLLDEYELGMILTPDKYIFIGSYLMQFIFNSNLLCTSGVKFHCLVDLPQPQLPTFSDSLDSFLPFKFRHKRDAERYPSPGYDQAISYSRNLENF